MLVNKLDDIPIIIDSHSLSIQFNLHACILILKFFSWKLTAVIKMRITLYGVRPSYPYVTWHLGCRPWAKTDQMLLVRESFP